VFVPVAFMRGIVGRFFFEFGLTVAFAVAISTFMAVTLSPMLCSRVLTVTTEHGRVFRFLERMFCRLEAGTRATLRVALHHRLAVTGGALARSSADDDRSAAGQRVRAGPGRGPIQHPGRNPDRLVARSHRDRAGRDRTADASLPGVHETFTTIGAGRKAA
jgi:hypothetical protein